MRKLKICLAMGGGVSLGSFSGSALTEAIKLLLLYGKDKEGKSYDKIIIDGMSGASAGALALTIMIKCLLDYKSALELLDKDENNLIEELANDYFSNDISALKSHKHFESLLALQVAQETQRVIWVKRLNIQDLLKNKLNDNYIFNSNDNFELLDRSFIEGIAKEFLISNAQNLDLSNKQLLDEDRIIFACSLTNMSPIEIKQAIDISSNNLVHFKQKTKLEENVQQSVGSENHSELRIIDFVFNDSVKTDDRWIKFGTKQTYSKQTEFSIASTNSWTTLSATAIACGAFPFALEPVLLKRYKEEFGESWPNVFENIQKDKNFKQANVNSFFNEEGKEGLKVLDYSSFNFSYLDGGTFNNEPIKEAYKIGSYHDFQNGEDNDRIILFVDPIVRQEKYKKLNLASYEPIRSKDLEPKKNNEFNKLTSNISNIVSVLNNQGSIKEEHKISGVKENLDLRKTLFEYISMDAINVRVNGQLFLYALKKIEKNLNSSIISIGTRDPIEYLIHQVQKDCIKNSCDANIEDEIKKIAKKCSENNNISSQEMKGLFTNKDSDKTFEIFSKAVFKLIIEFGLNTQGKNSNVQRIAILPINENLDIVKLPGSEFQAFGGFVNEESRRYAFEFAKCSTIYSLHHSNNILYKQDQQPEIIGLTELKTKLEDKVTQIKFFDEKNKVSLLDNLLKPLSKRLLDIIPIGKLTKSAAKVFPFFISAPIFSLVLLKKSIFNGGAWTGGQAINNLLKKTSDSLDSLALDKITISILSKKKLNQKVYIQHKSGTIQKIKSIQFKKEEGYQYLFQLSLLKYQNNNRPKATGIGIIPEDVKHLKLSTLTKVPVPVNIDRNISPEEYRSKIESSYGKIVSKIRIANYQFSLIEDQINDTNNTLFYSLKNHAYHINPFLEINLGKAANKWYFIENTTSLDLIM